LLPTLGRPGIGSIAVTIQFSGPQPEARQQEQPLRRNRRRLPWHEHQTVAAADSEGADDLRGRNRSSCSPPAGHGQETGWAEAPKKWHCTRPFIGLPARSRGWAVLLPTSSRIAVRISGASAAI
jgi:hypothetical protein